MTVTEKTRGLILTLFERVRDGKMTAEEATEAICRGMAASRRIQQEMGDTLMRHTTRLLERS